MEIRCYALVKSGLTTHKEVLNMDFEEFERLESFNILTQDIEKLHHSSFKGSEIPSEPKKGFTMKNDGSYTRG